MRQAQIEERNIVIGSFLIFLHERNLSFFFNLRLKGKRAAIKLILLHLKMQISIQFLRKAKYYYGEGKIIFFRAMNLKQPQELIKAKTNNVLLFQ